MNLVIFGLAVSSSWGNGHAALWRGLIGALARDGHRVAFFERDVPYYADHRDLHELPPGATLILYREWRDIAKRARLELAAADVGLITSYCPDALSASSLVLDSGAPVRCFYDLDTPVTISRIEAGETINYVGPRGLQDFDIVFSYTGGPALTWLERRLDARRAVPLYGCVDPEIYRPAPPSSFRAALSYLGTYAADRAAMLNALFLGPARRRPQERFILGGAQYPPDFAWCENIYFLRHVPPPDHARFYGDGRMTLNVTRAAMARLGWCPSGRLFEAAACGAPILSDWFDGLDDFFAPSQEILVARNTEEALDALSLSDAELAAVGRRARERALCSYGAQRRAREMVAALEAAPRRAES